MFFFFFVNFLDSFSLYLLSENVCSLDIDTLKSLELACYNHHPNEAYLPEL